jgi:alpha-amylase
LNESILQKVAQKCYLPANELMLKLCNTYGNKFRISYSISGSAINQFELYATEVIESFQKLAKTGCVEFLSETYPHSLASQRDFGIFKNQIEKHALKIEELFGQKPKVFRNTELIYSDKIGAEIYKMGFKGMLTEGAKHILGWKSPNYLYYNAIQPKLKLLLKNYKLSDDIAFRFSNKTWD